jgi:hypothetical protein
VKTLSPDTTPEAEAVWLELWRNAPVGRKVNAVEAGSRAIRELALAGVKQRHPNLEGAELTQRWAEALWGTELAQRAFGN